VYLALIEQKTLANGKSYLMKIEKVFAVRHFGIKNFTAKTPHRFSRIYLVYFSKAK
jgi:hypothetical protein